MVGCDLILTQSISQEVFHEGGKSSRFDGAVVVHLDLLVTIIWSEEPRKIGLCDLRIMERLRVVIAGKLLDFPYASMLWFEERGKGFIGALQLQIWLREASSV